MLANLKSQGYKPLNLFMEKNKSVLCFKPMHIMHGLNPRLQNQKSKIERSCGLTVIELTPSECPVKLCFSLAVFQHPNLNCGVSASAD